MTYIILCNGCGKKITSPTNYLGDPYNPPTWFSRVGEKGEVFHACSRDCIDKIPCTKIVVPL